SQLYALQRSPNGQSSSKVLSCKHTLPWSALHPSPTRRSSDLPLQRALHAGARTRGSSSDTNYHRDLSQGTAGSLARPWSWTRTGDRRGTRLNSSHGSSSYAVSWLKQKGGGSALVCC